MWRVLITACICFWDILSIWLYVDVNRIAGVVITCIAALMHIAWFLAWAIIIQASCEKRNKISFLDSFSNMIMTLVSIGAFATWMVFVVTGSMSACNITIGIITIFLILITARALSAAYMYFVRYPQSDEEIEKYNNREEE